MQQPSVSEAWGEMLPWISWISGVVIKQGVLLGGECLDVSSSVPFHLLCFVGAEMVHVHACAQHSNGSSSPIALAAIGSVSTLCDILKDCISAW